MFWGVRKGIASHISKVRRAHHRAAIGAHGAPYVLRTIRAYADASLLITHNPRDLSPSLLTVLTPTEFVALQAV